MARLVSALPGSFTLLLQDRDEAGGPGLDFFGQTGMTGEEQDAVHRTTSRSRWSTGKHSHNKEKTHSCEQCGDTFTTSGHVKTHRQSTADRGRSAVSSAGNLSPTASDWKLTGEKPCVWGGFQQVQRPEGPPAGPQQLEDRLLLHLSSTEHA
ncbi:hypothetical protein INR49_007369 [Caranx melampygus]|nr:hypothetical protein INR49_007369 [Caranx melampygus]